MKFLIDKNVLSKEFKYNTSYREDLSVIQDVLDEGAFTEAEITQIEKAGIKIHKVGKKHIVKLTEVLSTHGGNFKLLNLYTGKGTADVMMIAFILAEREYPETLFDDEYTIVTRDVELTAVAKSYNIDVVAGIN